MFSKVISLFEYYLSLFFIISIAGLPFRIKLFPVDLYRTDKGASLQSFPSLTLDIITLELPTRDDFPIKQLPLILLLGDKTLNLDYNIMSNY